MSSQHVQKARPSLRRDETTRADFDPHAKTRPTDQLFFVASKLARTVARARKSKTKARTRDLTMLQRAQVGLQSTLLAESDSNPELPWSRPRNRDLFYGFPACRQLIGRNGIHSLNENAIYCRGTSGRDPVAAQSGSASRSDHVGSPG